MSDRKSLPVLPQLRPCGPCDACCHVLGVLELGKPYYVPCQHQKKQGPGCEIHGQHPHSCRTWACFWAEESLLPEDERFRPDNLGVLFSVEYDVVGGIRGKWLTLYETRSMGLGKFVGSYITNLNKELVEAICFVWENDKTITGIRFIQYNSRVATSYLINGANYPDEGEGCLVRTFAVDASGSSAILVAPQRGTNDPMPPNSRPVSMIFHREKSPKERAHCRRKKKKKR